MSELQRIMPGLVLKEQLTKALRESGHQVQDFGPSSLTPEDDYPDYIVPLARSVASREVERGMAICGSGVGACVTANKVKGVRAALIHDIFSAHQGVEDDDMNVICFGRVCSVAPSRGIWPKPSSLHVSMMRNVTGGAWPKWRLWKTKSTMKTGDKKQ